VKVTFQYQVCPVVLVQKDPLEALQLVQQGQVARQEQSSQQGELVVLQEQVLVRKPF
jgi:hypothetical protein